MKPSKKNNEPNLRLAAKESIPRWIWGGGLALGIVLLLIGVMAFSGAGGFEKTVEIIPIHGTIDFQPENLSDSLSSDEIVQELKTADKNPSVAAILLDIQSPGGSVVATHQIVSQIRKTNKPVVAWIGDLGASGAYYSAAAADVILADPDSITGSIGVISLFPNVEGLLQKIGVKVTVLKEGKFKAIGSPFQDLSAEEQNLLQTLLHDAFLNFKKDIQSFRGEKLNERQFNEIADGRILSGTQALHAGLIDGLGTKEEAIQKAAALGGIAGEPAVHTISKPAPSLLDFFLKAGVFFGNGFRTSITGAANSQTPIQARG